MPATSGSLVSEPQHFSRQPAEMQVLLLEGVHNSAVKLLRDAGFTQIQSLTETLSQDALIELLRDVHYLGIRSRSQISRAVLEAAPELRAIGCFCIGVNQVDLSVARWCGVPVFNAPFSNTRSVAELVLAEAILLLRDIPRKNAEAHRGNWLKSASGAYEVRGKQLGIVGYGHIGTQVGLLAEALGMRVFFYDVEAKLALGNATSVSSLRALLQLSDVVTLHVPELPATVNMMDADAFANMRHGAALINASRGSVIDIAAMITALESGQLAGAALDVFPNEPKSLGELFESPLKKFDNVLLTPHVGGSTEEAQEHIGVEVAEKLIKFHRNGSTVSAVNFPEVSLPPHLGTYRLLHIHHNRPGVMAKVNSMFSDSGINIQGEYLQSDEHIGYVIVDFDIDQGFDVSKLEQLKKIEGTLRARIVSR